MRQYTLHKPHVLCLVAVRMCRVGHSWPCPEGAGCGMPPVPARKGRPSQGAMVSPRIRV